MSLISCLICGKEIHIKGFSIHLKKHGLKVSEYYDKYLKKCNEGFCKFCGKPTNFRNIYFGYSEYHVNCVAKDPSIQEKKKQNFL